MNRYIAVGVAAALIACGDDQPPLDDVDAGPGLSIQAELLALRSQESVLLDDVFDVSYLASMDMFSLGFEDRVSTDVLAKELEAIDDEFRAEPEDRHGDSGDIEIVEIDGGWEITLVAAWIDCPMGCVERRRWVYDLDESLDDPELVEEYGDALPEDWRDGCTHR